MLRKYLISIVLFLLVIPVFGQTSQLEALLEAGGASIYYPSSWTVQGDSSSFYYLAESSFDLTSGQQPRGVVMQVFVYPKSSDTETVEDAFAKYTRPPSGSSFTPYIVEDTILPSLAGDALLPANVKLTDFIVDASPDNWLYLSVMKSDAPIVMTIVKAITTESAMAGDEYSLVLVDVGANRDNVIKLVRAILDIDLATTEALVDSAPNAIILENVTAERADVVKMAVETAGASLEVLGGDQAMAEEGSSGFYNVVVAEIGASKINVIKAVRGLTFLGLAEAKDLVEKSPDAIIMSHVSLDVAESAKLTLEEAGATVTLEELP